MLVKCSQQQQESRSKVADDIIWTTTSFFSEAALPRCFRSFRLLTKTSRIYAVRIKRVLSSTTGKKMPLHSSVL